jgi:subtilisin family serine protease
MSFWVAGAIAVTGVAAASASRSAAKSQATAATQAAETQTQAATEAARIQADAATRAAELQAQSAREAAAVQQQIAQQQIEEARRTFEQQRAFLQPYQEPGLNALARIQAGLGAGGEFAQPFTMEQFQADPGYAFRLAEGQKALERQAAARGGLISGSALKAAQRFGQEMGSQEFQNAFARAQTERANVLNPLFALYGTGAETAGALSGAAGGMGSAIGGFLGQSGAAQAAGLTGAAQAGAQGVLGAGQAGAQGLLGGAQARASGYLGAGQAAAAGQLGVANALTGALGTGINLYQQQQLLNRLYPMGGGINMPTNAMRGGFTSFNPYG